MTGLAYLLQRLERHDTLPTGEALSAALLQAGDGEAWNADALGALWAPLGPGSPGWESWTAWAEERLTHWHSFKLNALQSAWQGDPGDSLEHRERCDALLRAVLFSLRQGLADHPALLPDAAVLANMAQGGHAFSWSQAYRELAADHDEFDLALDSPDLRLYCQISTHAFKYLTAEAG